MQNGSSNSHVCIFAAIRLDRVAKAFANVVFRFDVAHFVFPLGVLVR
jgi:hypothetical protein